MNVRLIFSIFALSFSLNFFASGRPQDCWSFVGDSRHSAIALFPSKSWGCTRPGQLDKFFKKKDELYPCIASHNNKQRRFNEHELAFWVEALSQNVSYNLLEKIFYQRFIDLSLSLSQVLGFYLDEYSSIIQSQLAKYMSEEEAVIFKEKTKFIIALFRKLLSYFRGDEGKINALQNLIIKLMLANLEELLTRVPYLDPLFEELQVVLCEKFGQIYINAHRDLKMTGLR